MTYLQETDIEDIPFKAVIFDLFETLITEWGHEKYTKRQMCADRGVDRLDNDIVPAKELGMKTVWVRQGYAVNQSIDDERKRPDHIVDNIDELIGLKL